MRGDERMQHEHWCAAAGVDVIDVMESCCFIAQPVLVASAEHLADPHPQEPSAAVATLISSPSASPMTEEAREEM